MISDLLSLHDRWGISDLVQRYAHLVDAREFSGVADLFEADAVLMPPNPPVDLGPSRELHGASAIAEELGQLGNFLMTSHGLLGHLVTPGPTADTAHGDVKCEAHHLSEHPKDGSLRDLVWLLRYRDDYRRTAGVWKFTRREITIDVVDLRTVKRVNPRPV